MDDGRELTPPVPEGALGSTDAAVRDARLLRTFAGAREPRARVVCVPYAGAGATLFNPWRAALSEDVELCAVHLPGRQDRLRETPFRRIPPIVHQLTEALTARQHLPTVLVGHSFGAVVAFELARALERASWPIASLVVGAHRAPHLSRSYPRVAHLGDEELVRVMLERYGGAVLHLRDADVMSLALPPLRSDLEALEAYSFVAGAAVAAPVTVLRGRGDLSVPAHDALSWRDVASRPVALGEVDGGHFFIDSHRSWVLEWVRRALPG